jgi:hypothetical protein
MFTITSSGDDPKNGRGVGKTTLVEVSAKLVGGIVCIRPSHQSYDRMMAVLLTPAAENKGVVLIDNLKSFKFSCDVLESLITSTEINGHRLNKGHVVRPNYHTFAVTVNGASYSKDMAERTVVIKLNPHKNKSTWQQKTEEFIEKNRDAIIADIRWHLMQKPQKLKQYDRWAPWCTGVLAKLPDADKLVELMKSRRSDVDEDDQTSATLLQHLEACIVNETNYKSAEIAHVIIPSQLMHRWLREIHPTLDFKHTNGLVAQHLTKNVRKYRNNKMRGYLWVGTKAETDIPPTICTYSVKGKS